jgi:4-amino-4-deoxy-L-arabinose transferase-like glycosyltransferase
MDRADLEQLDRDALIGTVLRQQETIERLAAEVASLKAADARSADPPDDAPEPPPAKSGNRWSDALSPGFLAVAAGIAAVLAVLVTPAPGLTPASGLAGWPRLVLYGLAGVLLGLSAPAPRLPRRLLAVPISARTCRVLGLGLAASLILTVVNIRSLRQNIADPYGPLLWIVAMLLLVVTLALPGVRNIGWRPLWPAPAEADAGVPQRWLGLGLIILVLAFAAATRLIALGEIPLGINPDEGDRAISAFNVLNGRAPLSWFDSGWYFINMVYFRVLAVSFFLFGTDVAGGRMLSALSGIGFVATVAWVGIRCFGWRTGLLAAVFAAGLGINLQHGRLITESGPTELLWALSLAGFLEGARTGRLWAWALAGLTGGLGLYFYPSARLWVIGAVLTVLVLLAYQRDRRLILGAVVGALATLIAAGPFLVHLEGHPDEAAGRYNQTTVLDPNNQVRLPYLNPPESRLRLLALQAERTLGMFDRYPEGGGFFPTGGPLLQVPLAQLALIGAVYLLVAARRDVRLAVLSIWFWLGLSGVLLTVETPNTLRAVGALPALSFVLALPLVDLMNRAMGGWKTVPRPLVANVACAVLAVALVAPEVTTYFTILRTMPRAWGPMNREAQVIEALGASGPVYSIEASEHMVNSGWVRLLAPTSQRGRIPNPGRELPVLATTAAIDSRPDRRPDVIPPEGKGLSVVLLPNANQAPYIPLLRRLYPGGFLADAGDGRRSYQVGPDALAATRGVTVLLPDGSQRAVSRFGEVPSGLALPARLTWRAGVQLPRGGAYTLSATSPGPVELRLDAISLASGSGDTTVDVTAAPGLHFLELTAEAASADRQIGLTLTGPDGAVRQLTPAETYRLMDAPWGLLARIEKAQPSRSAASPADSFLDSTVAMAFFEPELGPVSTPNTITWSGSLLVPRTGVYRMGFSSDDTMRLEIDGRPVQVVSVRPDDWQTVGAGSEVRLTEGRHAVRVFLDVTHGGRDVARWNWVPPMPDGRTDVAASWAVVPPNVLRPDPPVVVAPRR